jgi:hypothetical protein
MTVQRIAFAFGFATLGILAGCGGQPATSEAPESKKPLEPVTGQSALYQMYRAARAGWALDVQVLRLDSIHMADAPEAPGKSGAWEATFLSPSLRAERPFTYSVVEVLPDFHKGAFAGPVHSYSPSAGAGGPFLIAAVKTDSDAAYQTALAKAAPDAKRIAGKPVTFFLGMSSRFPGPAWRIVWGESVAASSLSIFIDASTGQYLETVR